MPTIGLGLLQARDRRFALQRTGTGQRPDGLVRDEPTTLTNLPFELGIRLGTLRVLVSAHGLSASTIAVALAVRPFPGPGSTALTAVTRRVPRSPRVGEVKDVY